MILLWICFDHNRVLVMSQYLSPEVFLCKTDLSLWNVVMDSNCALFTSMNHGFNGFVLHQYLVREYIDSTFS